MNEQEKLQESVELVLKVLRDKLSYISQYIDSVQGGDESAIQDANSVYFLIQGLENEFGDLLGIKKEKTTDIDF